MIEARNGMIFNIRVCSDKYTLLDILEAHPTLIARKLFTVNDNSESLNELCVGYSK